MGRTTRLLLLALLLALLAPSGAHGWENGRAPASALSRINSGIDCRGGDIAQGDNLSNAAAAGWNTMALAARKQLPVNGCDSAYRSYPRQVYWRNYWCSRGACGNAATPGYSNHGLGLATDEPQWVRGYVDLHGRQFGWCKCWSDAPWEWWHVKFNSAAFSKPNPGINLYYPHLRLGSGGPGQSPFVLKLQRLLIKHGATGLRTDGQMGRVTATAVKRFETAEGFASPDGVVTRATWKHLKGAVIAPTPRPPPPSPSSGPLKGVDVSVFQGSIDWQRVKADGMDFAIIKATEGQDYKDAYFSRARLRQISGAHLVPGAYHFLRPRSDRPGSREANWFTQVIANAGYGAGYLRPVADLETTTLSPAGTCAYILSFAHRVHHNLGVSPIIYTYPSFAASYLSGCTDLARYKLWIANYGVSHPTIPHPWSSYLMWQFSSTGRVSGIGGNVDVNTLPGGRTALQAVTVKPQAVPARLTRTTTASVAHPLRAPSTSTLRNLVPTPQPRDTAPKPEGASFGGFLFWHDLIAALAVVN